MNWMIPLTVLWGSKVRTPTTREDWHQQRKTSVVRSFGECQKMAEKLTAVETGGIVGAVLKLGA